MSWARTLVRKAAAATTRVLGGAPPVPPPVGVGTQSAAAAASSSSAASKSSNSATASSAEQLAALKAENAKLKHTFRVIKVKLDKTGKASAVVDGAGTPAASINAHANHEIRDIIARILAQEKEKADGERKLAQSQSSLSGSTASLASPTATTATTAAGTTATAATTQATVATATASATAPTYPSLADGLPSSSSPSPPAPSAPSAPPAPSAPAASDTASATVTATAPTAPAASVASSGDVFAQAQKDKYGDQKSTTTSASGTLADGAAAATAAAAAAAAGTPVAMYYGEDVYASKEEAETQSGVKLLCYGNLGVNSNGKVVYARDPRYASAVFASDEMGVDDEEVIIVDLDETKSTDAADDEANWWSIVDNPNPSASKAAADDLLQKRAKDTFKEEPAIHLEGPRGTPADGFAVIEEDDMISAISDYSAQCVRRFPGARAVDPQQLNHLLASTFAQAEPPSALGRIWRWGSLAYTGYGWASYAYYLAKQPAVVRGAYSIVKWVLVLLI